METRREFIPQEEKQETQDGLGSVSMVEALGEEEREQFFANAKKDKCIGKGAKSQVWRMKGEVQGDAVSFVRKKFQNTHPSEIEKEFEVLSGMRGSGITPVPFRRDKKSLDMEYIEGVPFGNMKKSQRALIPEKAFVQLKEKILDALVKGYINGDFNVNNFIFNPQTQELHWIDFGGTKIVPVEDMVKKDVKNVFDTLRKTFPNFPGLDTVYKELEERLGRELS